MLNIRKTLSHSLRYYPNYLDLDYIDSAILKLLLRNSDLDMGTTQKIVASSEKITPNAVRNHIKEFESLHMIQIKPEKKRSKNKKTTDNTLRTHKMLILDKAHPLVQEYLEQEREQTFEYERPYLHIKLPTQSDIQEDACNLLMKLIQHSKSEDEYYMASWKLYRLLNKKDNFDRSFLEKLLSNFETMKENIIPSHL